MNTRRPRGSCSPAAGSSGPCCSSPRRWRSCTSCCRSCSACTRRGTGSSTATAGGSPSPRCSKCARSSATCGCSEACSCAALTKSAAPGGGASARIGWPESYQITMAGLAATRLFAAAGAGGIALTAWALRRSGMPRRTVAVPADRVHSDPVRGLHDHAGDRWRRPVSGRHPRRRLVRDHDRARDLRRGRDRPVPRAVDAARRRRQYGRPLDRRRAPCPPAHVPAGGGVGGRRRRRAGGNRPRPRAQPQLARGRRVVGVRHLRAVGVLPRVRRLAARRA